MKRVLAAVLGLVCLAGVAGAGVEFNIPNLEGTVIYDFEVHGIVNAVTSKVMGYKDVDFRIGYTETKKVICGISYDLKNLEKLGVGIKYFWGDWNLTIGAGMGYDFSNNHVSANLSSVLLQVNFK